MAILTTALLDPYVEHSRPQTSLAPRGLVLHSTATPGATARNVRDYFNGTKTTDQASAHLIVDWIEALLIIPVNEVAWHAGHTANGFYLGRELCETQDAQHFHDSFLRWIEAAQVLFNLFGWPVDEQHLWSHQMISSTYHEMDHTDPIGYLVSHDHTWDVVVARIKSG